MKKDFWRESWKEYVGKYMVTEMREIESVLFGFATMSNTISYGIFKILPYNEELFPEVNYKVVLEPIERDKYIKRAWYISDLNTRFDLDNSRIFDTVDDAIAYSKTMTA